MIRVIHEFSGFETVIGEAENAEAAFNIAVNHAGSYILPIDFAQANDALQQGYRIYLFHTNRGFYYAEKA